jgi:hypothetical protein
MSSPPLPAEWGSSHCMDPRRPGSPPHLHGSLSSALQILTNCIFWSFLPVDLSTGEEGLSWSFFSTPEAHLPCDPLPEAGRQAAEETLKSKLQSQSQVERIGPRIRNVEMWIHPPGKGKWWPHVTLSTAMWKRQATDILCPQHLPLEGEEQGPEDSRQNSELCYWLLCDLKPDVQPLCAPAQVSRQFWTASYGKHFQSCHLHGNPWFSWSNFTYTYSLQVFLFQVEGKDLGTMNISADICWISTVYVRHCLKHMWCVIDKKYLAHIELIVWVSRDWVAQRQT